ncbi:MAG: hypothetical protein IPM91_10410 [Bacteroidetes bacterium]|nr:hypothetical protein [Bacteroidota bacterium]
MASFRTAFTDLERTLIDIAIRPSYSGGVTEVLRAYELAKEKADIQKLRNYLTQMDFIYPYHQVIGFYLEKAGYSDQIQHLFASDNKYKFYLTYSIKNLCYQQSEFGLSLRTLVCMQIQQQN